MSKKNLILYAGIPIVLFLLYLPWSAPVDLWISKLFYENEHFQSNPFLDWIYHYGIIPGWILTGIALIGLVSSLFSHTFKTKQKALILIVLTLAIGSGVIVHLTLKDHWGRPRPRQTIEFGGIQPFRAIYSPNFFNQPESSKSFPCGHCTMGFCFFSLIWIGNYYRKNSLIWMGLICSFIFGGLLGYARIAQGGHFLSDVLVSALIMWLTSFLLFCWLFKEKN